MVFPLFYSTLCSFLDSMQNAVVVVTRAAHWRVPAALPRALPEAPPLGFKISPAGRPAPTKPPTQLHFCVHAHTHTQLYLSHLLINSISSLRSCVPLAITSFSNLVRGRLCRGQGARGTEACRKPPTPHFFLTLSFSPKRPKCSKRSSRFSQLANRARI